MTDLLDPPQTEIDHVTYEVIRHNLWNINEEHGLTIANVSGSPIAAYAHDFNPCILTETGEFVYFGAFVQLFGGMTDLLVKWILENRAENPGIRPGDMFLSNDPFIATHHQSDVFLVAPVFWEGELFGWIANALHQYDIGGTTPGSFCVDARDIYDEPTPIPPIKIVSGGEICQDVLDMYLRQSRLPEIVGLDLRAQIAGNNVALERMQRLIERHGAGVVKGVMRRIISDSEKLFVRKLETIPDGEWHARGYMQAAHEGDRELHVGHMQLRKRGDRLVFSNAGTDPQIGTLNTTFAGWRGAIMCVLNPFLCSDSMYAIGGALRHVEFDAEPGTLLTVEHPGATSCSAAYGTQLALDLAHECVVKMLSASPELRPAINAPGGHSQTAITTLWGTDQRGQPYGTMLTDHLLGSLGAFTFRDGVSTGGIYWDVGSAVPNVEFNEQHYPILYLYRRETPDTGGAGLHRGGNSAQMAFVPHGTERIDQATVGAGLAVPSAAGLAGGNPGATSAYKLVRGSGAARRLAAGEIPAGVDGLDAEPEALAAKVTFAQAGDDVLEVSWTASAGYGDPLERSPESVRADVALGAVTPAAARATYGVALDGDRVDEAETARLRDAELERRARLGAAGGATAPDAPVLAEASEQVVVVATADGPVTACARCRAVLTAADSSYKHGCLREDVALPDALPGVGDPSRFVDPVLELRAFYCPGCRRRLATEVARADDPVLDDGTLDPIEGGGDD